MPCRLRHRTEDHEGKGVRGAAPQNQVHMVQGSAHGLTDREGVFAQIKRDQAGKGIGGSGALQGEGGPTISLVGQGGGCSKGGGVSIQQEGLIATGPQQRCVGFGDGTVGGGEREAHGFQRLRVRLVLPGKGRDGGHAGDQPCSKRRLPDCEGGVAQRGFGMSSGTEFYPFFVVKHGVCNLAQQINAAQMIDQADALAMARTAIFQEGQTEP
jgi:hypothetical protein